MTNSVGDVNSDMPQKCELENIEYRENITAMWMVDDEGNPGVYIDSTERGDFQCYYCDNCDEEFEDWSKVKEHLA